MSKEKTQPQIDIVNSIRKQLRKCKDEQTIARLKKELKMANKIRNIVIAEAKEHYMSKLAKKCAISGNKQQSRMESNTGM